MRGKECPEEHNRQQNVADDGLEAGVALVVENAPDGAQAAQQDHRQYRQHHGKNLGKHSVLLDVMCCVEEGAFAPYCLIGYPKTGCQDTLAARDLFTSR